MLDLFRKSGLKSIVYGAIIIATVLAFVIGWPNAGRKTASLKEACVATVRGFCVDPKSQKASYRILIPRDQGGNLLTARAKSMGLSRITLDGLIERELLIVEAERLGLSVTEDEINDSIFGGFIYVSVPVADPSKGMSLGVRDGHVYAGFRDPKTKQFDMKTYERQIRVLTGRSAVEFREWQGRELLAAKMRDLVRAPVRTSDTEAFELYQAEKSSATVDYVSVKTDWVERWAVAATRAQIEEWAKDKSNAAQVKAPNIRHILIKPDAKGDAGDGKAEAKAKAEDLIARIKKGEDFAKLARQFSADPGSGSKGGDLGTDKTDGFVEPFKKGADALKAGDMTDAPVESQFGFHIIRKDDPARAAYVKAKSQEIAHGLASKIHAGLSAKRSPDAAIREAIGAYIKDEAKKTPPAPAPVADAGAPDAAQAQAKVEESWETDPERPQLVTSSAFNHGGDPIPSLGIDVTTAVMGFAFNAKDGELMKEPVRANDGYVIVSLKSHRAATREDFDKERDAYVAGIVGVKQAEALSSYVRRLREAHKEDIKIDESYLLDGTPKADGGAPAHTDDDEE